MLTMKWTPDAKSLTLVPGSQWMHTATQRACLLIKIRGMWVICHKGEAILNERGFSDHDDVDMQRWLACAFEPLDTPQDTRTVGELEPGECFVGPTSKSAWMRTGQEERDDIVCVSLYDGVVDWFSPLTMPRRILGKINPDDIAAVTCEAGGVA